MFPSWRFDFLEERCMNSGLTLAVSLSGARLLESDSVILSRFDERIASRVERRRDPASRTRARSGPGRAG